MKLVTIILLLCVHTADLNECKGVKKEVVFCDSADNLEIKTPSPEYAWHFGTPDGELPSELTPDESKNLKGILAAKHTGVYLAIKTDKSQTDKFTIIVDAKSCNAGSECIVKPGDSIKLDSAGAIEAVSWEFEALGSTTSVEITDSDKPKFHLESTFKKQLGLFNVQKAESGKYRTKKTSGSTAVNEFPVSVYAPVSGVTVKGGGCDGKLECQFTGDAKTPVKWTKDGNLLTPEGKTLTVGTGAPASGKYACKVLGHHSADPVTSATFPYTSAVSTVSIKRSASVLTCVADGAVKRFEWLTFGNVAVSESDGAVGSDPSQFTLDAKAKGQFICKVTACDDKNINSPSFAVSGVKDASGSTGTDQDNSPRPTAATQGASCSVALLVISVLIELYVVMMM